MKLSITYKILLAFLFATVVVVLAMLFLMQWSFEKGFLEYVNTMEQQGQENLSRALIEIHEEEGSLDSLRGDRRRWFELQISSFMNTDVAKRMSENNDSPLTDPPDINITVESRFSGMLPEEMRQRFEREGGSYRPMMHGTSNIMAGRRMTFNPRITLLDKNNKYVVGRRGNIDRMETKPIVHGENVIGYLAMIPRNRLFDNTELQFTERQGRAFTLIAIITLVISTVVILPLSRSLVKPIKTVGMATRKLASGEYGTRISVGANDEIGRLSRDFNSLAKTLEKNEQARRQWIADISHELRTPLTILRGEIEAIQDGVRELTPERLNALHPQVMNLNRLVDDLYELSLSDIGAMNYQKNSVCLKEILLESLAGINDDFNDKNISIEMNLNEFDKLTVFADFHRIKQLFTNLLVNSHRYTDNGGNLTIHIKQDEKNIVIDFMDSEPGVPEDQLPLLFDRLYRLESSRNRQTGGMGLGMSICKNIVEAHDGKISASTSPMAGLWVKVEMPREIL